MMVGKILEEKSWFIRCNIKIYLEGTEGSFTSKNPMQLSPQWV